MCGLSGFVGVTDPDKRTSLVIALAVGIDERGGHAAGYVTIGDALRYGRRVGEWAHAGDRFFQAASSGPVALMHARFATHNNADKETAAHPFAIKRGGRTVLWGAHNGASHDAWSSAHRNGRTFDVDSRELFELIADGKHAAIGNMYGWGVLSWITRREPHTIKLCVASEGGALEIVKTKCGAIVYASTKEILNGALEFAGLEVVHTYDTVVGVTYGLRWENGVATLKPTNEPTIKFRVEEKWEPKYTYGGYAGKRKWVKQENGAWTVEDWNEDNGWNIETGERINGYDRDGWCKAEDGTWHHKDDEDESKEMPKDWAALLEADDNSLYDSINDDDFDRAAFLRWLEKNAE